MKETCLLDDASFTSFLIKDASHNFFRRRVCRRLPGRNFCLSHNLTIWVPRVRYSFLLFPVCIMQSNELPTHLKRKNYNKNNFGTHQCWVISHYHRLMVSTKSPKVQLFIRRKSIRRRHDTSENTKIHCRRIPRKRLCCTKKNKKKHTHTSQLLIVKKNSPRKRIRYIFKVNIQ